MKQLNLNYYSGKDLYSDGAIERDLIHILSHGEDLSHVLENDSRWPILYHLSPIRKNILNWFPFNKNCSLLEIGSGCGAITGLFCEKIDKVVAVELSMQRSYINSLRNAEYDNLEIIVGNLEDIKFEQKFDYITLIGVLEYAISFIKGSNPFVSMLKMIAKLLKPGGKIFIAIENKYGMKYWAGAKEDHTGKVFDGITGYSQMKNVRTFGKIEIQILLESSGFSNLFFYYPHPDYKMPLEIFSQDYLPNSGQILPSSPNFDQDKYELFDESQAFKGIIENGQYEFFANSFLVVGEK